MPIKGVKSPHKKNITFLTGVELIFWCLLRPWYNNSPLRPFSRMRMEYLISANNSHKISFLVKISIKFISWSSQTIKHKETRRKKFHIQETLNLLNVEMSWKCSVTAVEVALKCCWNDIKVPLKCKQTTSNSHSHRPCQY